MLLHLLLLLLLLLLLACGVHTMGTLLRQRLLARLLALLLELQGGEIQTDKEKEELLQLQEDEIQTAGEELLLQEGEIQTEEEKEEQDRQRQWEQWGIGWMGQIRWMGWKEGGWRMEGWKEAEEEQPGLEFGEWSMEPEKE